MVDRYIDIDIHTFHSVKTTCYNDTFPEPNLYISMSFCALNSNYIHV